MAPRKPKSAAPRLFLHPLRSGELLWYSIVIAYLRLPLLALFFTVFAIGPSVILSHTGLEALDRNPSLNQMLGVPLTGSITIAALLVIQNWRCSTWQIVRGLGSTASTLWAVSWRLGIVVIMLALVVIGGLVASSGFDAFERSAIWLIALALPLSLLVNASSAIAVTETVGAEKILSRMWWLTRQQWRTAITLAIAPSILALGTYSLLVWLVVPAGATVNSLSEDAKLGIWGIVFCAALPVLGPVFLVGPPLLYLDARCRQDGFHLETLRE